MGELAISSLDKAFEAFKTKDMELALKVIDEDEVVDDLEIEINHFIIWLLAKAQPGARDFTINQSLSRTNSRPYNQYRRKRSLFNKRPNV